MKLEVGRDVSTTALTVKSLERINRIIHRPLDLIVRPNGGFLAVVLAALIVLISLLADHTHAHTSRLR